MITGGNPDPMRTYELDKRIPEVISRIGYQADIYQDLVDQLIAETGMEGEHTQALTQVAFLLRRMYSDTDRITRMLSEFRDSLGSIGNWIYQTRSSRCRLIT